MEYVLQTFGLTKKYKNHAAVDNADINICKGDIYGFVGENGSGKTTVIRLITGLISPTSGSFSLFGVAHNDARIHSARSKIGAIVETPSIYLNMSASDNLRMQCTLWGIKDETAVTDALRAVGLENLYAENKHAGDFSLGMRQRLGIAMALIGKPEFLILDEPMNGLDPAGIVEIRELILKLNREQGITFLISSHILSELSLVATKYGIISHGHILREITAEQLHEQCGKFVLFRAEQPDALSQLLQQLLPQHAVMVQGDTVKVVGEVDLNDILSHILQSGNRLLSIHCGETGFEQYYLSLVGGDRRA